MVKLEGTFRILDENWRSVAHEEIRRTVNSIASSMGAEVICRIVHGNPSLANDIRLTNKLIGYAREFAGGEHVTDLPLRMTGEDFARYAQRFPSVFYRLGTGSQKHTHPVHHPEFDVDESSITHGMGMMAWLSLQLLNQD
jgi:metal-dependent amidase/aminoacylase/carboxypeptidase family protein